jgi:hypothetical protein
VALGCAAAFGAVTLGCAAARAMGWSTLHPTARYDARAALVASVTAAPTAAAAAVMTAVSVATAAQRAGFVGGATAQKEEGCYDRAGASSPCQQRASVPTPAACPRPYQLGRGCGSAPGTHAPALALLSPPSPPAHPSPIGCCWCSSETRAASQGRGASRCRPTAGSGWSSRATAQKNAKRKLALGEYT